MKGRERRGINGQIMIHEVKRREKTVQTTMELVVDKQGHCHLSLNVVILQVVHCTDCITPHFIEKVTQSVIRSFCFLFTSYFNTQATLEQSPIQVLTKLNVA